MSEKLFNRKPQKKLRQYLRNNATDAERILWSHLKGKQFLGYKFRRQQGIGKYIVDFYSPKVPLAIELDGSGHLAGKQIAHDKEKDDYIKSRGIRIIRFTNADVYEGIDAVLQVILDVIEGQEANHP